MGNVVGQSLGSKVIKLGFQIQRRKETKKQDGEGVRERHTFAAIRANCRHNGRGDGRRDDTHTYTHTFK